LSVRVYSARVFSSLFFLKALYRPEACQLGTMWAAYSLLSVVCENLMKK
jgi:hypothetical protein